MPPHQRRHQAIRRPRPTRRLPIIRIQTRALQACLICLALLEGLECLVCPVLLEGLECLVCPVLLVGLECPVCLAGPGQLRLKIFLTEAPPLDSSLPDQYRPVAVRNSRAAGEVKTCIWQIQKDRSPRLTFQSHLPTGLKMILQKL